MSKPSPRKYPNQIMPSRPEGMSHEDYKAEQTKQRKILKAYMRGERVPTKVVAKPSPRR